MQAALRVLASLVETQQPRPNDLAVLELCGYPKPDSTPLEDWVFLILVAEMQKLMSDRNRSAGE